VFKANYITERTVFTQTYYHPHLMTPPVESVEGDAFHCRDGEKRHSALLQNENTRLPRNHC